MDLVEIYSTTYEETSIADILSEFLQCEIYKNDGRPSNICSMCKPKLLESFDLLIKAKNSEKYFQQILSSNVDNHQTPSLQSIAPVTIIKTEELAINNDDPLTDNITKSEADETDVMITDTKIEKDPEIVYSEEVRVEPLRPIDFLSTQDKNKSTKKATSKSTTKSAPKSDRKPAEKRVFECYICHKMPLSRNGLTFHLNNFHKNDTCVVCGKHFAPENLNRHLCQGQQITCEYCPKDCQSTHEILQHLDTHRNNLLFYKCHRCKESFNMKTILSWHDGKHERFQFSCEICGKTFEQERSRIYHTRFVHSDERSKTFVHIFHSK